MTALLSKAEREKVRGVLESTRRRMAVSRGQYSAAEIQDALDAFANAALLLQALDAADALEFERDNERKNSAEVQRAFKENLEHLSRLTRENERLVRERDLLGEALREISDAAIYQALQNMGIDTSCGVCMSVAFTGASHSNNHTCAHGRMKAALKSPGAE